MSIRDDVIKERRLSKINIDERYVKEKLSTSFKIPTYELSQELIDLKRATLLIKRESSKMQADTYESKDSEKYSEEYDCIVFMVCKKHGPLGRDKVILSGKQTSGNQRYKCKLCMKELHALHYLKNKDKVRASHEEYRARNPEKYLALKRKSCRENSYKYVGMARVRNKRIRDKLISTLDDKYIKKLLVKGSTLKQADIPQELVDIKKTIVKIKRLKKGIK